MVDQCWRRVLEESVLEERGREVGEERVGGCCREALEKSVVETYWRRGLKKSVVKNCWRRVL